MGVFGFLISPAANIVWHSVRAKLISTNTCVRVGQECGGCDARIRTHRVIIRAWNRARFTDEKKGGNVEGEA